MSDKVVFRVKSERREKLRKRFEDNSYWPFIKKGPVGLTIYATLTYPRVFFNHVIMKESLISRLTIYQETYLRTLKWSSDSSLKSIRKTGKFMESLIKTFRCSEPFRPLGLDAETKIGTKGYWLGPIRFKQEESEATILYFHGGGYVALSSLIGITPLCYLLKTLRNHYGKHVRVMAIDLPTDPFPSGLECAERSYKWLIESGIAGSKNVFLCGDSAGAGLALALLQRLYQDDNRSSGGRFLLLPLGAILISPWVELSCDALSFFTNAKFDWLPESCEFAAEYYVFGEEGNPARKRLSRQQQRERDIIMEWLTNVEDVFEFVGNESELNKRLSSCSDKTRKRLSRIRDSLNSLTNYQKKRESLARIRENEIEKPKDDNPFNNPLISPLHIPHKVLAKFPPLFISYGGKEMFKDDIEIFIQKCIESKKSYAPVYTNRVSNIVMDTLFGNSGLNINNVLDGHHPDVMVETDEDMVHDYPILIDAFGKHSRRALDRIAYFIANMPLSKPDQLLSRRSTSTNSSVNITPNSRKLAINNISVIME